MHWKHLALILASSTFAVVEGLPLVNVNHGLEKRSVCRCRQACPKPNTKTHHKRTVPFETTTLTLEDHKFSLKKKKITGNSDLVWSIVEPSVKNPKGQLYYYAKGPVVENEAQYTGWYWESDFLIGRGTSTLPGTNGPWIVMPKVGHRLREWAHFRALMKNPEQCRTWVRSTLLPHLNGALQKFHDKAAAKNQGTNPRDWMFGDIKPSHSRLVLQNPRDIDNQAETPFTIELIDFGASHRRKRLETKVEEIREESGAEAYSLAPWIRLCDEAYKDTSSQEGFDSQKDSSSDDAGPKAGPSGVGRSGHSSPQPGAEVQPATQGETVHPDDHSYPPRAATATPPGAHDDGTHGSEGSCNCCKTQ